MNEAHRLEQVARELESALCAPSWAQTLTHVHAAISAYEATRQSEVALRSQIERLAEFILHEVPGEPSQSEGAVDTAIRWMRATLTPDTRLAELEQALRKIADLWPSDMDDMNAPLGRARAMAAIATATLNGASHD